MKLLLFVALSLSVIGPPLAVDAVVEERAATGFKRPKTLGNAALLSVERRNASILGDDRFLGKFSHSQANFAKALAATTPTTSSGKLSPAARIAFKLLGGTVAGIGSGIATIYLLYAIYGSCGEDWCTDYYGDTSYGDTWEKRLRGGLTMLLFPTGIAVGVSAFDRDDRFIYPLAASVLGFGIGLAIDIVMAERGGSAVGALAWLPLIAAIVASEESRERPESRRYSIGLRPEQGGGLSAVAALRF